MPNMKQALRISSLDCLLCIIKPGFTRITSSHIRAASEPDTPLEVFAAQNVHGPSEKRKADVAPFSAACLKGICLGIPPRTG
jgi:hypothetical protein